MIGIKPERDKPYVKNGRSTNGDITGLIGFADEKLSGSVALSFPKKTILKMYEAMMGEHIDEINKDIDDIVGEVTNIVVGGAKNEFSELGYPFNISLPLVVEGKNHVIKHRYDSPIVVIPLLFDKSASTMEICIKLN
jgi:chemotaxis protein CheX